MSPYKKAVLAAIRVVAAGLVLLSICLCLPDVFLLLSHKPLHSVVMLVLKMIPMLAGIWLLWKSDDIAEKLTNDLD